MFLVIQKIAKIRTSSFFLKKNIIWRLTFKTFGLKDFETRDNARTKKTCYYERDETKINFSLVLCLIPLVCCLIGFSLAKPNKATC